MIMATNPVLRAKVRLMQERLDREDLKWAEWFWLRPMDEVIQEQTMLITFLLVLVFFLLVLS